MALRRLLLGALFALAVPLAPAADAQSVPDQAVAGPPSTTDDAIARFDGLTGRRLQSSPGATIGDGGLVTLGRGIAAGGVRQGNALVAGPWLMIGNNSGGTLTNVPNMGLKIELDTEPPPTQGGSGLAEGLHVNVNIKEDAHNDRVLGIVSRIDVRDHKDWAVLSQDPGEAVAQWADVLVHDAAGDPVGGADEEQAQRQVWGNNTYVAVGTKATEGTREFSVSGVGMELAFANYGANDCGSCGALHMNQPGAVGNIRYFVHMDSVARSVDNFIMAHSNTSPGGFADKGADENFIWYGPITTGNTLVQSAATPPEFQVNAEGRVGIRALADSTAELRVGSVNAGAVAGPVLDAFRNSNSAADNDVLGQFNFTGNDDAASPNKLIYGAMRTLAADTEEASEDGVLQFGTVVGGTLSNTRMNLGAGLYMSGNADPGAGLIAATAYAGSEVAVPTAPAENGFKLFAKDDGTGKTQLCVRFATGAEQCFAAEP